MNTLQIRSLALVGTLLLSAASQSAVTYSLLDIGTLGGSIQGIAINSSGDIVGLYYPDGSHYRAFRYANGSVLDLGTLGGTNSYAEGINSLGQAVGHSHLAGDATQHTFLYSNGVMSDLGTLGGSFSAANGINTAGHIIGVSDVTGNTAQHAFLYKDGVMLDLGTLGGLKSNAIAINEAGVIVGTSNFNASTSQHTFRYENGVMVDLGTLGGKSSDPQSINLAGQITGGSQISLTSDDSHAFLFDAGQMIDIGTLGGTLSYGMGINSSGQIAGVSTLSGNSVNHGFLYADGAMLDINDLLDSSGNGYEINQATGINDSGQIVARYQVGAPGTELRTVLLTPTYTLGGRIRQGGNGVPGVQVDLIRNTQVIATTTTNAGGYYSFSAPGGSLTVRPRHSDKLFFPGSKEFVPTPSTPSKDFTAGNIGPASVSFQYPVVYSDRSGRGTLGLNAVTPVDRIVTMFDNSFKLTAPTKVTVPGGSRTADFYVYGVSVNSDTTVTVTATHQGLTATGTIVVRQKPTLTSMTLASYSVRGGVGVSGGVTIDKPAIGAMPLQFSSSAPNVASISPELTTIYDGTLTKPFYCKTLPVATTQNVTLTSTFYGSSKAVTLAVTP